MTGRFFWLPRPRQLRRGLFVDESGATAVEYGLIVTFIAIVIVASVQLVGVNLSAFFQGLAAAWPG